MPDKKTLAVEVGLTAVKTVIGVASATAVVLVFYFSMESRQNQKITKNTTTLAEHVKQADKTFENIDRTMREQRTANEEWSRTVVEISTVQRSIRVENGRLADSIKQLTAEIQKKNGGPN